MSMIDLAQYSYWIGWLTAGLAWALALSMAAPRVRAHFGGSYWLVLAWLLHVGLFFSVIRLARALSSPLPPYAGNIWSAVVYLQALFSIAAYLILWHRYRRI